MSEEFATSGSTTEPHFAAPSTSLALVPGVLLLFLGLWMVSDGAPLALGWAAMTIGLTMTLIGTVALGVSWGLALDRERR